MNAHNPKNIELEKTDDRQLSISELIPFSLNLAIFKTLGLIYIHDIETIYFSDMYFDEYKFYSIETTDIDEFVTEVSYYNDVKIDKLCTLNQEQGKIEFY